MKRILLAVLAGMLILGGYAPASARQSIYIWVKDRQVSSDDALRKALRERVVNLPEAQALEAVRRVMTDDLFLSLAAYHPTKHIQDGETTADTVLPEEVVRQQEIDLVDENYDKFRFILQIRLKAFGGRTRIAVKAQPMYRVHDVEAEDQANSESAAGVDIKVRADAGQAVAVGPVFVTPREGSLADYPAAILPDASIRAAALVRSFIYLLDKRAMQTQPQSPQALESLPAPAHTAPPAPPQTQNQPQLAIPSQPASSPAGESPTAPTQQGKPKPEQPGDTSAQPAKP